MARNPKSTKTPARLPRFRSDQEVADFFDSHSAADYWNQLEDPDVIIEVAPALVRKIKDRMRKRLLALRIEEWQIRRAKQIAKERKIPYQQLMREWISQGIRAEAAKKRKAQ